MPLPELFLQELKARSDIVDVVSSYVNLRRRGRNMVGLCPFHSEKTPSFNLYPENGSFYCFGCGAGGDVITFIRRIENLDYMEAVRFLAQRAGLEVPEHQADDGMAKIRARILEINRETARFYHAVLASAEGAAGMRYLRDRALMPHTIRHFGLGYAPDSRFALCDHLTKRGYRNDELIRANVAVRTRSGRVMDRFFARVMFPIIDLRGNVIAFGGRILTNEKPKYLNTSDTPVFKKSGSLFAMNFAKNSGAEQLILAEGYMDVIALHQAGFSNAVATLGTALTPEQARLMARYTKKVAVCYDSDEAGQKAAARSIAILRSAGLLVKIVAIPGNKDPDEFIKAHGADGPSRFKKLLASSGNDVEYQLGKLRGTHDVTMAEGRVAYLGEATSVLAALENRIEREVYAGRLAEETGVDKRTILSQAEKQRKRSDAAKQKREFREFTTALSAVQDDINPEKHLHLRAANAEEALISYVFSNQDDAPRVFSALPPEKFCTSFNRRVYQVIMGKMNDGKALSLTDISEGFSVGEIGAIARILAKYSEVPCGRADADADIAVISEESEKLSAEAVQAASPEAIQDYLARLRDSKK